MMRPGDLTSQKISGYSKLKQSTLQANQRQQHQAGGTSSKKALATHLEDDKENLTLSGRASKGASFGQIARGMGSGLEQLSARKSLLGSNKK